MEIVHIASELAPVAKVGGLGDVLHGLARAFLEKKQSVEIILPKYDTLHLEGIEDLHVAFHDLSSFFEGGWRHNTIWQGHVDKIPVTLIEAHDPYSFFNRGKIYGCDDDILRFGYFCRASLDYLLKIKKKPDILHIHDWHTALIPLLNNELFPKEERPPVVFTIHNLAYQGICDHAIFEKIGLSPKPPVELKDPDHPKLCNLMRGGIYFSDYITTVSPNYAHEILTTSMSGSLQESLQKNSYKLSGVLNGIDYSYWNPQKDPYLPFHFSAKDLKKEAPFISEKAKVKAHVRELLSLAEEDGPLVGVVTRLVPQKGPELIKEAMMRTLEWGGQFILLGSTADEKNQKHFYNLKRTLAGSRHLHIELTYNEKLSHLIFAASDLLIIPSLYEPCGLTQMIAMHYGTLPLVRETGGLADSVFDEKNGFTFLPPTREAVNETLDRALTCWFEEPEKWHSYMHKALTTDFSWKRSAEEYMKIYRKISKSTSHV